jgi:hypothetical protein
MRRAQLAAWAGIKRGARRPAYGKGGGVFSMSVMRGHWPPNMP